MTKQIKVLHTEWSDGWGGQEIQIINESLAMQEKFNVKTFIACRSQAQISSKASQAGLSVVNFGFKSSFDVKTIFGLVKFIKQNDIDIINSHSGKDTWVAAFAAKIAGTKFIRTRHLSNPINTSRLNFVNELADFVITTGESVKNTMIKDNRINPSKILSIPTGIDEKIFNPQIYYKDECLAKFGLEKGKIYVGILAVLRQFKRHDIFLQTALNLHDKFPNVIFLIAGDGPQKQNLQNFIDQNNMHQYVKMLGHVQEQAEFLKAIDVFMITSSDKEGVSQSLMQALLMQKPCIAADIGSTRDLYDQNNFILIEFGEKNFQIALEKLLSDAKEMENLSRRSREFVKNNFTKDKMCDKIYEIYKKLTVGII